jgi:hypothetical protein
MSADHSHLSIGAIIALAKVKTGALGRNSYNKAPIPSPFSMQINIYLARVPQTSTPTGSGLVASTTSYLSFFFYSLNTRTP